MDNCEACGKPAGEYYQRNTDRKFVCFDCLPAKQVTQYPGWREREALKHRRATQARANFATAKTGSLFEGE